MLQALGLGPAEEAVYTTLLAHPTASAQELVRQTGLEEAETTRVLLDLAARGLVAIAAETASRVTDPADSGAGPQPARYRLTPPPWLWLRSSSSSATHCTGPRPRSRC